MIRNALLLGCLVLGPAHVLPAQEQPLKVDGLNGENEKKQVPEGAQWSYDKIIEHLGYNLKFIDGVIWVIDQSPSMEDDVEKVRGELDKWFKILDKKAKVGLVTYSDKPRVLLKPTDNRDMVKRAFGVYKTHAADAENLYAAIAMAANLLPKGENLAVVVATDEVGDDDKFLIPALRALNRRRVIVYAISPNATFGNRRWDWTEIDPIKRDTQRMQSQNGPETGTPEVLFDFHFIQRGPWGQFTHKMDTREWATRAGWAPYNLQMLAQATGGAVYNLETDTFQLEGAFENVKHYRPDFSEPSDLSKNIRANPWRAAVHKVATVWDKSFKRIVRDAKDPYPTERKLAVQGIKQAVLPAVKYNKNLVKQSLSTLRRALEQDSWSGMDKDRSVLRWRANLELAYANCLVAYFHLLQFEQDFVRFSRDDYVFQPLFPTPDPKNTAGWKIVCIPDGKQLYTALAGPFEGKRYRMLDHADHKKIKSLEALRTSAEAALKVVMYNHPETPWAALATKTLSRMGHYEVRSMPVGAWSSGKTKQ